MISAVSGQPAATIYSPPNQANAPAGKAGADALPVGAASPAAPASRSVVVSISDAARQKAAEYEANGGENAVMRAFTERFSPSTPQGTDRDSAIKQRGADLSESMKLQGDLMKLNVRIARQAAAKDALGANQDEYDRLLKTDPKPAVELTGQQKSAALDLLKQRSYAMTADTLTFADEKTNLAYTFKKDGSVWVNQADVPTSAAFKQTLLDLAQDRIALGQQPMDDVLAQRDAMQSRYDALQAAAQD